VRGRGKAKMGSPGSAIDRDGLTNTLYAGTRLSSDKQLPAEQMFDAA